MNINKTGKEYLAEFKKVLEMPSRDFIAWESMSNGERSLLIRNAKLEKKLINDAGFAASSWSLIQPADQQKIREAAKRAAAWVNELELI